MSAAEAKKLELFEWLANVQDEKIIEELFAVKEGHERVSIEQYNREIEEADAEIDRGEFLTHEEAMKEISAWREK